jgi:outer membrane lipoprotein SlyB
MLIIAPVVALSAACSKEKPADPSLNTDLGLAAQASTPLDSVTAAEQTQGATPTNVMRSGTTASAPKSTSTTTRKSSSTTTKSSGTSTASSSTSGTSKTASTPTTTVEKHTKRDAAIGAAAGAIIGATTSKDKVKGAVIGGAAGAILGGVIGNNVDKKTTTKP